MAVGVLSGNRNFEGRVHPHTRANYLASPLLVVAYAIAGTVDIDLHSQPLGESAPPSAAARGSLAIGLVNSQPTVFDFR